jgi:hypothetical protein
VNVSAASRYDAFLAVREAAARRMEATSPNVRQETQRLTRTPMAVDHGLASQAALAPIKGQRVDFLA